MIPLEKEFHDRNVCVLGLGYVGLTLAAVMADAGFNVVGVEKRKDVVSGLRKGRPHFFEPGLDSITKRLVNNKQIKFFTEIPPHSKSSVYIITVGTPLDQRGKARLDMVEHVSKEVAAVLKKDDLVIVRSTTKIGMTRKIVMAVLKSKGVPFDLAFCPERTLEGQALPELRQLPQIVGGATSKAAIRAAQLFQFITPTVVRVNDMETAEMVKLIDNTSRDVGFAFANEVARMCDTLGISAIEVIRAGKLGYPRTNIPLPGLVGGPCLEKDSYILAERLIELGRPPEITLAARKINERLPVDSTNQFINHIKRTGKLPERPVILLMGLAFKGRPATDDLRGTLARPVINMLKKHFPAGLLRGYDPIVSDKDLRSLGLKPFSTIESGMKGAHLMFILNNHAEFSNMPIETLALKLAKPSWIYDFWNSFTATALQLPEKVGYMALGSHGRAIWPSFS